MTTTFQRELQRAVEAIPGVTRVTFRNGSKHDRMDVQYRMAVIRDLVVAKTPSDCMARQVMLSLVRRKCRGIDERLAAELALTPAPRNLPTYRDQYEALDTGQALPCTRPKPKPSIMLDGTVGFYVNGHDVGLTVAFSFTLESSRQLLRALGYGESEEPELAFGVEQLDERSWYLWLAPPVDRIPGQVLKVRRAAYIGKKRFLLCRFNAFAAKGHVPARAQPCTFLLEGTEILVSLPNEAPILVGFAEAA